MSHRSRTMSLLAVACGALAVVTSGFADAWACSPASYFVDRDLTITFPEPGQVRADLHLVALYTNPNDGERPVITLEDQKTEMMVQTKAHAGKSVLMSTERITLTQPGTYYFWTFVRDVSNERVERSLLGAAVIVPNPPKVTKEPLLLPTSTIAPTTTASPTTQGETLPTTPATLPTRAVGQPEGLTDRRASGAQRPARSVASPSVAPQVATPPAVALSPSGVPLDIRPSPASAVGLDLPLTPEVADLWSGMQAVDRAPSLLDAAPPVDRAGSPLGAGLLGIGLLALVGVGAVAGERRLALARRAGS